MGTVTPKVDYDVEASHKGEQKFHFYAASFHTWRTNKNLDTLLADMKADGERFIAFLVPCDEKNTYEINFFTPQVDGIVFLGQWSREK